jgi:hypothetical protein
VAPTLMAGGGALEEVVVALLGCIASGALVVIAGFLMVQCFSCWKKAVAEFEGKVLVGVAAAERDRKAVPTD